MQLFGNFEKGVGTYLKVIRYSEPTNPDGFVVLYLRPNGRFLFVGYWSGYERSLVTGRWVNQGTEVRLEGRGRLATDVIHAVDRALNRGTISDIDDAKSRDVRWLVDRRRTALDRASAARQYPNRRDQASDRSVAIVHGKTSQRAQRDQQPARR